MEALSNIYDFPHVFSAQSTYPCSVGCCNIKEKLSNSHSVILFSLKG
jgi:hypothetical protein